MMCCCLNVYFQGQRVNNGLPLVPLLQTKLSALKKSLLKKQLEGIKMVLSTWPVPLLRAPTKRGRQNKASGFMVAQIGHSLPVSSFISLLMGGNIAAGCHWVMLLVTFSSCHYFDVSVQTPCLRIRPDISRIHHDNFCILKKKSFGK